MREKIKLIGFYNYTVILTYIGMLIGFMGIMLVLKNNHVWALICLMVAGVCDMFDGTIASTKKDRTKDEKSFGIQIDSLSDLICFGVLPSVWVMSMSDKLGVLSFIPCLFILCGLIRLAYFNVDEANRQAATSERRSYYLGLPITASALAIPAVYVIGMFFKTPMYETGLIALLIVGICYVLPFHLKKPKFVGELLIVGFGAALFCIIIAEAVLRRKTDNL